MTLPVRRAEREVARPGTIWDPFGEDFERLFDFRSLFSEVFTPLADVEETDDAYVVEIELPGVKRDDLDIDIAGRRLSVRGERKEKERVGILRRRERTVGRFAYEVSLPGDVDEDSVEAHLDEGVLTVRLPKPEQERPRRIEIR